MVFSLFRAGTQKRAASWWSPSPARPARPSASPWLTANALSGARPVRVAALGGLTAAELAQAGTLLVVTSTYGAGEAPDTARAFVRKQMTLAPSFKGLEYAVLAPGRPQV